MGQAEHVIPLPENGGVTIRHAEGVNTEEIKRLVRWQFRTVTKHIRDAYLEDPEELRKTRHFCSERQLQAHTYCKCVNPDMVIDNRMEASMTAARTKGAAHVGFMLRNVEEMYAVLLSNAMPEPFSELEGFDPEKWLWTNFGGDLLLFRLALVLDYHRLKSRGTSSAKQTTFWVTFSKKMHG